MNDKIQKIEEMLEYLLTPIATTRPAWLWNMRTEQQRHDIVFDSHTTSDSSTTSICRSQTQKDMFRRKFTNIVRPHHTLRLNNLYISHTLIRAPLTQSIWLVWGKFNQWQDNSRLYNWS